MKKKLIFYKNNLQVYIHEPTNSCITDLEITVDIVKKELVCLNANKSTGPDDIHPRLLKELAEHIGEHTVLFNKLIRQSITE